MLPQIKLKRNSVVNNNTMDRNGSNEKREGYRTNVHKTTKFESPNRNRMSRDAFKDQFNTLGRLSRNRQSVGMSTESVGMLRKKTPINSHMRKHYEKQQVIMVALEAEEAKEEEKRLLRQEAERVAEMRKHQDNRDHINRYVKMNQNKVF